MSNIQITEHGRYTKRISSNSPTQRIDKYTSNNGDEVHEQILCADINDNSDVFTGKYDPKCGACWLGYGHTVNKHNKNIKQ